MANNQRTDIRSLLGEYTMSIKDTMKRLMLKKPAPGYVESINEQDNYQELDQPKNDTHGENQNPYLTARRTWNENVGSVVSAKQTWQVVGILSLLIALSCIGGLIHIGSQSKFVPYLVEVDKLGASQASGIINRTTGSNPKILGATVSEFIENARLVSPDIALQRKAIFNIYAHLSPNDPGTIKMNEWLNGTNESNPFKRAAKEMVNIEIASVLPQTPTTWQVDWIETTRDRKGILKGKPSQMRALVTIYQANENINKTEEEMRKNPLSLYVRDFSWSLLN